MSNNFWSAYKYSKRSVEDGVWIDDFEGGVSVKIRKPSSLAAREARRKLEEQEPYRLALKRAQRKKESLPVDLDDKLNKEWVARGIIVDWKDVPTEDGQGQLPFTPENALDLFDKLEGFYEDVMLAATTEDAFKQENSEEDQGNSPKS